MEKKHDIAGEGCQRYEVSSTEGQRKIRNASSA